MTVAQTRHCIKAVQRGHGHTIRLMQAALVVPHTPMLRAGRG